ncbi:MAG: hypothetical protein U0R26_06455 [Solirubrobacterales bacterium]
MAALTRTGGGQAIASSCCSSEAQADCCEPSEQAECCAPESSSCGCQAGESDGGEIGAIPLPAES